MKTPTSVVTKVHILIYTAMIVIFSFSYPAYANNVFDNSITITERAIERLLIAITGGFCVYFGYRLFSIVSESKASLEVQGKEAKLKLKDIGPGVLFCLFGVALQAFAILHGPKVKEVSTSETGQPVVTTYEPALGLQQWPKPENEIWALNKAMSVLPRSKNLLSTDQIEKVGSVLDEIRYSLISGKYNSNQIETYRRLMSLRQTNPNGYDAEIKLKLEYRDLIDKINTEMSGIAP